MLISNDMALFVESITTALADADKAVVDLHSTWVGKSDGDKYIPLPGEGQDNQANFINPNTGLSDCPTTTRDYGCRAGKALNMQTDHYFALYTVQKDENDDESYTAWVRPIMAEGEKHADENYLHAADFMHRRTKFWGEEAGKRLM